jgi:hypothetical protein
MKTPRTDQESKMTPRTGVAVVEAAFAAGLETELHEMSIVLARIVECGGIGSEDMFDDARELLTRHSDLRKLSLANRNV